jgi:hypothetical protein
MRNTFCNTPAEVSKLLETTLKPLVDSLPPFESFVYWGTETSPSAFDLYRSADPFYSDPFIRIFPGSSELHFHTGPAKPPSL